MDVADGPAALLPGGNVLFQASPGIFNIGSKFFTWNGTKFSNVTWGNTDAPNISSYWGNMMLLPTGEVLYTDFGNVWVFQSSMNPKSAWLPQILSAPTDVKPGQTYVVAGLNFNGFSQGAAYGDDVQGATNYPLVQITNRETGRVYYARTHGHSTMGIAYTTPASTNFDVSGNIETGLSGLRVVRNGHCLFSCNDEHRVENAPGVCAGIQMGWAGAPFSEMAQPAIPIISPTVS